MLRERHVAFKRGEESSRGQGELAGGLPPAGVAVYDEEEDSDVELEDARALASGAQASFEDTTLRPASQGGKVNSATFDEDEDEDEQDEEDEEDGMLVDEEDDENEDAEEEEEEDEDDGDDEDGL